MQQHGAGTWVGHVARQAKRTHSSRCSRCSGAPRTKQPPVHAASPLPASTHTPCAHCTLPCSAFSLHPDSLPPQFLVRSASKTRRPIPSLPPSLVRPPSPPQALLCHLCLTLAFSFFTSAALLPSLFSASSFCSRSSSTCSCRLEFSSACTAQHREEGHSEHSAAKHSSVNSAQQGTGGADRYDAFCCSLQCSAAITQSRRQAEGGTHRRRPAPPPAPPALLQPGPWGRYIAHTPTTP